MMQKKKISFLLFTMSGGGAEKVISQIFDRYTSEYEIVLILFFNEIVYDIPPDVRIHIITNETRQSSSIQRMLNIFKAAIKLKRIIKEEKIDNSVSFMYRANFSNVLAKLMGAKAKVILNERSNASAKTRIFQILLRRLYPKADSIIPNSQGSAFLLKNTFSLPEHKIQVIHNPIDIDYIASVTPIERDPNTFIFITVGRLIPSKNHKMLLAAFSKLDKTNKELWIIGNGELKDELKAYTKKLNIIDTVKFLGFQKNPYEYLKAADCFVFPTNYEGLPNVLMEALACELPSISTDCKFGPREILTNEADYSISLVDKFEKAEYGILTPVGKEDVFLSAMQEIVNNTALFETYKSKTKSKARVYEKETILNQFNKAYFE